MVKLREITNREYQNETEHERCTGLKIAEKSMFQYLQYKRGVKKDTQALSFGRLWHTVLEGDDAFSNEFAVMDVANRPEPDKTMASKLNKEWALIIKERAIQDAKQVCSLDDYEKAVSMRRILHLFKKKDRSVLSILKDSGTSEMSLFCDDYFELKMKVQIDLALDFMLVDYKSVADASQREIEAATLKWGWDMQIALYSDIFWMYLNKTNEIPDKLHLPFLLICQEKKEPYDFCFYDASDFYKTGKLKILQAIDKIKAGIMSGYWNYIPETQIGIKLNVPSWALTNDKNEVEEETDETI